MASGPVTGVVTSRDDTGGKVKRFGGRRARAARVGLARAQRRLRSSRLWAWTAAPLVRRFGKWPHWHHFVVNLMIGLAIEVVLHFMVGGMFITGVKNLMFDASMNIAAHMPAASNRSDPPIAVFDIDEETWRSPVWGGGEPDIAPRSQLARLVEIAVRAKARYVIVDIVVEGEGNAADGSLLKDMLRMEAQMAPDQRILFVRSIRHPDCGMVADFEAAENQEAREACLSVQGAPTVRRSRLDPLFRRAGGHFVPVTPNFILSRDGVLRDWVLWKPACVIGASSSGLAGTWQVMPSVQLAILEMERLRLRSGQGGMSSGETRSVWPLPGGFGVCLPTLAGSARAAPESGREVSFQTAEARMIEALSRAGEHGAEAGRGPGHDLSSVIFFRYREGTGSAASGGNGIQTLSALPLLEGRSPGDLSGQIVIIAQSHELARDHHLTPLGRMPGAMILANSINSLHNPGLIEHAPSALETSFVIVSIVLAAWLFAVVRAEFSLLLAIAFVPILLGLSYLTLSAGIKLGSEVAILGIYLHWIFKTIEVAVGARKAGGHGHGHDAGDH